MKISSPLQAGLLAATLGLSFGSAHANLLSDGDFENFASMVADAGYATVNAPGPLGGWTVGGTSVDLIRNAYGAINDISVDLTGTPGPGSLSQSFTATAGVTYTLSFDYFKNAPGSDMTVSFGGQTYTLTPGAAAMSQTYTWTAPASGTEMVMFSGGPGFNGPTLDNVVLTAAPVPEPSTVALLLAGFGVMGFVARRRRVG